ncbi:MAG: hypothetical protein ACKVQS_14235 [Fimbriimonadaceae bacterium]
MKSAIALLALVSMAAPAQDMTQLEWKPKVGEVTKLKFNMAMNVGTDVSVSFLITSKTTKVEKDEVTTESEMGNFELMVGGQPMDMGGQAPGSGGEKMVTVHKLNGVLVSDSSPKEMGGGERMNRMNAFLRPSKPVKIGDFWENEWKADKEKGLQNSKARWTLAAYEPKNGVDCWKVDYVYAEMDSANGISANGSVWISAKDGGMEYTKYDFQNVSFQDGMPPANGTGTVTRVH